MRTYRQLLVLVAEDLVMASYDFQTAPPHYQQDYKNAVKWLKSLPEEFCPEVTDDMIAQEKKD
jgi:hypothetical protein